MNYYPMYGGYEHMAGWGLLGIGFMILFWVIIAMIILRIIRWSHGGHAGHRHEMWAKMKGEHSALSVLNERYAKGEINKEEYEQKKKDISS